jgi:hypothetical protein
MRYLLGVMAFVTVFALVKTIKVSVKLALLWLVL